MEKLSSVVIIKKFPFFVWNKKIYPLERELEIKECKNEKTRNEKFYVWKLLQKTLKKYFGIDIKKIDIKKEDNGKWTSNFFKFSLSHSKDLVAVGISYKEIGVDIQERKNVDIKRLIKNENDVDKDDDVLLSIKEAIYKSSNDENFVPRNIETKNENYSLFDVKANNENYILSIKCEDNFSLSIGRGIKINAIEIKQE